MQKDNSMSDTTLEKAEKKNEPLWPVAGGYLWQKQKRPRGIWNQKCEGSTSNKTTKNKGYRFNVFKEQPDEEMETEFTNCPGAKYKTDALNDITNVAGRGGRIGKCATIGLGVGRGGRDSADRAQIPKSIKAFKGKTYEE
ncbi:hypothetical protein ACOSP7_024123 [Xanthoceras sorbifolium]